MLAYGLELIGFDEQRQGRVGRKTNLERFGQHYGSTPLVVAALWEKLQTTKRPAARIRVNRRKDLTHFFQALHWMKCYPREGERSGIFKFCEKTCRKWGWHYTTKISQLKDDLVRSFQMFVVLIQCYDWSSVSLNCFAYYRSLGQKVGVGTKTPITRSFCILSMGFTSKSTNQNILGIRRIPNIIHTSSKQPALAMKLLLRCLRIKSFGQTGRSRLANMMSQSTETGWSKRLKQVLWASRTEVIVVKKNGWQRQTLSIQKSFGDSEAERPLVKRLSIVVSNNFRLCRICSAMTLEITKWFSMLAL